MTKKNIFFGLILLALGGLIGSRWQQTYDLRYYQKLAENRAGQIERGESRQVSLMLDDSVAAPVVYRDIEFKENQTLFDLTKDLAKKNNLSFDYKDFGEMGYLITQIGDKINGQDNKFWQYWVNNEQVQVAANKYILRSNDIVLWKFAASKF